MLESLMHLIQVCLHWLGRGVENNPGPLMLVAGYIIANLFFYFITKGKEFAIVGYTGVLFLVPYFF